MHLSCTKTRKTSPGRRFRTGLPNSGHSRACALSNNRDSISFLATTKLNVCGRRHAIFVRVFNVVSHHTAVKLKFDWKGKTAGGWNQLWMNWWHCDGFGLTRSPHQNVATCQFWDHTKKEGRFQTLKINTYSTFPRKNSTKWKLLVQQKHSLCRSPITFLNQNK